LEKFNHVQREEFIRYLDENHSRRWKTGRNMDNPSYVRRGDVKKIMRCIKKNITCKTLFNHMVDNGQYLELLYFSNKPNKVYIDEGVEKGDWLIIGFTENTTEQDDEGRNNNRTYSVLTTREKCVFNRAAPQ
jgi:hypothetical protein